MDSGVFAASNGEGKQVKYLEAVLSPPAVCFPSSSVPAPTMRALQAEGV